MKIKYDDARRAFGNAVRTLTCLECPEVGSDYELVPGKCDSEAGHIYYINFLRRELERAEQRNRESREDRVKLQERLKKAHRPWWKFWGTT